MQKVADLADLAEWMEALFPGGRERDAQLLEMAGRFVDGSVARGESIVEEAPTHRRSYLPPPAPLPSPSPWASLPYERRASARGRRRSWRMAFALLLGVTVGALGTRLWAEHAGWGTPRAAEAPAFAEAPHFRPTSSEVLPMRASPPEEQGRRTEDDVVPLGLARVWDPGPTASPTK